MTEEIFLPVVKIANKDADSIVTDSPLKRYLPAQSILC
jgi:hypothetical protein